MIPGTQTTAAYVLSWLDARVADDSDEGEVAE